MIWVIGLSAYIVMVYFAWGIVAINDAEID